MLSRQAISIFRIESSAIILASRGVASSSLFYPSLYNSRSLPYTSLSSSSSSISVLSSHQEYIPKQHKRWLFGFGEKKDETKTEQQIVPTEWSKTYGPVHLGMRVGEQKAYSVQKCEVYFSIDPSGYETSFKNKLNEIAPSLSSAADHFLVQNQSPGSILEKAGSAIMGSNDNKKEVDSAKQQASSSSSGGILSKVTGAVTSRFLKTTTANGKKNTELYIPRHGTLHYRVPEDKSLPVEFG